jgi:YebC/PmpR family DNA-binding regulatory protein
MSGHSKWKTIQHTKGAADAKRGAIFTKLSREIIIAVRQGGGPSQDSNFKLRLAVQKARDASMPYDNIDRAIKKGAGTAEGVALEEMIMEGYSASGAAVLVQAVSDNRNRTVQEIRNVFNRNGGSLGAAGCVAWIFDNKGVVTVKGEGLNGDDIALMAIDAGADDVKVEKDYIEIYTLPENLEKVRIALTEAKVPIASSQLSMIPKQTVTPDEKGSLQTVRLLDKLEELDDVQNVATNAEFTDELMEKISSQLSG